MAKQHPLQKFTPTPPTSARPSSSRSKRRVVRAASQPTDQIPSADRKRQIHNSSVSEQIYRQTSFSNYEILPPIHHHNSKSKQIEIVRKHEDVPDSQNYEEEKGSHKSNFMLKETEVSANMESNNSKVESQRQIIGEDLKQGNKGSENMKGNRRLYRKGDIFKDSKEQFGQARNASPSNKDRTSGILAKSLTIPPEPDMTNENKFMIAFRIPNRERVQRHFLKNDRIGDIFTFLQSIITPSSNGYDQSGLENLELFTNDVPTKKLDNLRATLEEAGLSDRTVLNVMVLDDS